MKVIMVFTKNIVQDKLGYFGPTMAHSHNSGLALRIFLTFYRMKGADRYMIILLVVFFFENKMHLGQFDLFRPFSTDSLDMVEIEIGHFYYWILKQSRHDLFHDYCWILKQLGHD